nr:AAA family ATPase [Petrachloros mirabilis]
MPGSGKSTLAQQWVAHDPNLCWVSTDAIRQNLFGDAAIQGAWPPIEAEALRQIKGAIAPFPIACRP